MIMLVLNNKIWIGTVCVLLIIIGIMVFQLLSYVNDNNVIPSNNENDIYNLKFIDDENVTTQILKINDPNKTYLIEDRKFMIWQPDNYVRSGDEIYKFRSGKIITMEFGDGLPPYDFDAPIFAISSFDTKESTLKENIKAVDDFYYKLYPELKNSIKLVEELKCNIMVGYLQGYNCVKYIYSFTVDDILYYDIEFSFIHNDTLYTIVHNAKLQEFDVELFEEIIKTFQPIT